MEDIRQKPELVDYYRRVNTAYQEWAKGYTRSSMITVDRDRYDFIHSATDRATVLDQIETKLVDLGKLSPKEFDALQAKHAAGPISKFA